MANLDQLLSRLDKVNQMKGGAKGARWLACCPAHDDKTPSLSITLTVDDRILVHCWAGCEFTDIVAAVGMSAADFFPESGGHQHYATLPDWKRRRFEGAKDYLGIYVQMYEAAERQGEEIPISERQQYQINKERLIKLEGLLHG